MRKAKGLVIIGVLLITTTLYTVFIFLPSMNPDRVVDTSDIDILGNEEVEESEEIVFEEQEEDILETRWSLEVGKTNMVKASVLNSELPPSWEGREIFFKYTYLGEYDERVQENLDEMMATEYAWEKQLDSEGNILMGGPILKKDEIYQLHTHNAFTQGERNFLLGDLIARYSNQEELVGTEIMLGNVKLRAIWEKDTRLSEDATGLPGGELVISTCLERDGDRRLLSGWEIVED
jgi:hypothetical protein